MKPRKGSTTPTQGCNQVFVGLDLSLNGTGVAILRRSSKGWQEPELHTLRVKRSGVVTKTFEAQRLVEVFDRIEQLGVFRKCTMCAIEDYAYGKAKQLAGSRVFQLGELGGVIRFNLFRNGIPFIPCPIGVNKQFGTGYGAAEKKAVAAAMSSLWDLPEFGATEWDASDALSLASIAAFKALGGLPGMQTFNFQSRVVGTLEIVTCKDVL